MLADMPASRDLCNEQCQSDEECRFPPVQVGKFPRDGDHHGLAQHVCRDHPGVQGGTVQLAGYRRTACADYGAVQTCYEHRQRKAHHYHAADLRVDVLVCYLFDRHTVGSMEG